MKRLFGFTLAETLIVMGIIGVVAALTLPNLNSSTGDKEKVTKLQKIYSNLNDAIGRAEIVYGPITGWTANDNTDETKNKRLGERITEFMKISKNCGTNKGQGCFKNSAVKYLNNSNYINFDNYNYYKVILADGSSLSFHAGTGKLLIVNVDIDGPNKGSNTFGKDFFEFWITSPTDGILPMNFSTALQDCFKKGSSCTKWVIDNGNMDYLKADNDGKCPD